ncbi:MAG: helix-turn-helix transcriptional regulator [Spirochaetales bacterium]|nr:helix-turn-helix transcriptional regulator [Spirochaetales bacterium]
MAKTKSALLFSQNLKRIRKAVRLTQEELAERCGVSKNYISQLEMGSRFPSDNTLDLLIRETEYDLFEFFVEPDDTYHIKRLNGQELAIMESIKKMVEGYKPN